MNNGSKAINDYMVLNADAGTLSFERAPGNGTSNTAELSSEHYRGPENGQTKNDSFVPGSDGEKVIIGSIYDHPEQVEGMTLVSGISTKDNGKGGCDKCTAKDTNAPVFAIDKNNIHEVDQNGKVTNNQPKTIELLRNALEKIAGIK